MAPTPRADGADGTECAIAVTFERIVTECAVSAAEMPAWAGAEISTVASAVPKIVNVLAARKGTNRNRMRPPLLAVVGFCIMKRDERRSGFGHTLTQIRAK